MGEQLDYYFSGHLSLLIAIDFTSNSADAHFQIAPHSFWYFAPPSF